MRKRKHVFASDVISSQVSIKELTINHIQFLSRQPIIWELCFCYKVTKLQGYLNYMGVRDIVKHLALDHIHGTTRYLSLFIGLALLLERPSPQARSSPWDA